MYMCAKFGNDHVVGFSLIVVIIDLPAVTFTCIGSQIPIRNSGQWFVEPGSYGTQYGVWSWNHSDPVPPENHAL